MIKIIDYNKKIMFVKKETLLKIPFFYNYFKCVKNNGFIDFKKTNKKFIKVKFFKHLVKCFEGNDNINRIKNEIKKYDKLIEKIDRKIINITKKARPKYFNLYKKQEKKKKIIYLATLFDDKKYKTFPEETGTTLYDMVKTEKKNHQIRIRNLYNIEEKYYKEKSALTAELITASNTNILFSSCSNVVDIDYLDFLDFLQIDIKNEELCFFNDIVNYVNLNLKGVSRFSYHNKNIKILFEKHINLPIYCNITLAANYNIFCEDDKERISKIIIETIKHRISKNIQVGHENSQNYLLSIENHFKFYL